MSLMLVRREDNSPCTRVSICGDLESAALYAAPEYLSAIVDAFRRPRVLAATPSVRDVVASIFLRRGFPSVDDGRINELLCAGDNG